MIEVIGFGARAGRFALSDITFTLPASGYGVIIGPAGAGKTTLLEAIAGVGGRTTGLLRLGGNDATGLPPEDRGVGLVYQHAHLFTHLSVTENIRYGAADAPAANEVARRLGADALTGRPVESLSGGERQLVALARALAPRPAYLLLDEPFSALDPGRRAVVRREVRAIARERGTTVLQVTHDFTEAGYLGDLLIMIDAGRLVQVGAPEKVFHRPATPYVAAFIGAENIFAGSAREADRPVAAGADDARGALGRRMVFETAGLCMDVIADAPAGPCHAVLRGEEVLLSLEPLSSSARNRFAGVVEDVSLSGPLARVTLVVDGTPLVATLTRRSADEMGVSRGMRAFALFKAMAVHLC